MYVPPEFIAEYPSARKQAFLSSNGWWLNRWPLLAWVETFFKVFAWYFAFNATSVPSPHEVVFLMWQSPAPPPWEFAVETYIMIFLTGLMTLAIVDRLLYRELISILFIWPQMASHWAVLLAMRYGRQTMSVHNFRMYLWLELLGDVAKFLFFYFHKFDVKPSMKRLLYFLVSLFAVGYAVILRLDYDAFGVGDAPLTKTCT